MSGESPPADGYHRVLKVGELREREGRRVVVEGRAIAIFLHDGKYSALTDRCAHNGMPLHDGCVENGVVTCRWHGWRYDLSTGRPPGSVDASTGPRVRTFPVRVRDGWIEVSPGSFDRHPPSSPPEA